MSSTGGQEELVPLALTPTLKRPRGNSSASNDGIELAELVAQAAHSPNIDSDSEGSAEEIDLEDLVEQITMSARDDDLINSITPAEAHARIKQVGVEQFVADLLNTTGKTPASLGAQFGLDPDMFGDEDVYMMLLQQIVIHSVTKRRKIARYNTIDDAAELLRNSKNVMIITGAGISTSLGIPDFRSKHTGFYSKLQEMGYSEPEEVFDIYNFDEKPEVFYSLAGDILPKGKEHTPTHAFIRLLQDQGRLQTNYTQNIDNLEANAGLSPEKVIQCHGSFATASCRKCKHQEPGEEIFGDLRAKKVAYCKACIRRIEEDAKSMKPPVKKAKFDFDGDDSEGEDDNIPTPGVMKPDITFFGEQLPNTFFERFLEHDSHTADLVIVIGTSMKVAPVADMPNHLPSNVPHIYISREACSHISFDIQLLGDCDAVCWELSRRAGWDLKHGMIPDDFSVKVDAFDDSDHHWRIATATATPPPTLVV